MQDMTSEVCATAAVGDSVQLKDTRDGKYYWTSKLADGKCWMTQNLDLDLSTRRTLTPNDSDVHSSWTPNYATATTASSSTILADDTGQRSWDLGNYRIATPTTSSDCGSGKSDAADCPSQFTPYPTPTSANGDINAHYILGNHYQWNSATAGTGIATVSDRATSSICPKGWKLPTSNAGGEYGIMAQAVGIYSSKQAVGAPFYGVVGGTIGQETYYLFQHAGNIGFYWSSTPVSDDRSSYGLYIPFTAIFNTSGTSSRSTGASVRCIAR
jgi:uncharacterized protein (TIGR02145 family)